MSKRRSNTRTNTRSNIRARRKKNQTGRTCIAIVMLFMVAVMAVQIVGLYRKNKDYSATEQALEQELLEQEMKKEELKAYEEYVGSDEYTEEQAQTKLGLIKENEIIFRQDN